VNKALLFTAALLAALAFTGCPEAETEPQAAAAPQITVQPQDAVYTLNAAAVPLRITAAAPDGGTLRYQWYYITSNNAQYSQDGTLIPGAAGSEYTPPTTAAGTLYYYVEVTNSGPAGSKPATTLSENAAVVVVRP
jgi:hypothetical protein